MDIILSYEEMSWNVSNGFVKGQGFPNGPQNLCKFYQEFLFTNPPDSTLINHEGTVLSYEQVAERSRKLGASLSNGMIGPGDTVAIVSRNLPEALISFIAITTVGAQAAVMWNTWKVQEIEEAVVNCGAKYILADNNVAKVLFKTMKAQLICLQENKTLIDNSAKLDKIRSKMPGKVAAQILEFDKLLESNVLVNPVETEREQVAAIFYNNETKSGLKFSHRALVTQVKAMLEKRTSLGLDVENLVILTTLPLADPMSLVDDFLLAMAMKSELVIPVWSAKDVVRQIQVKNVNELSCTVDQLTEIVKNKVSEGFASLKTVRVVGKIGDEVFNCLESFDADYKQQVSVFGQLPALGAAGSLALFNAMDFQENEGIRSDDLLKGIEVMVAGSGEDNSIDRMPVAVEEVGTILVRSGMLATASVRKANDPFLTVAKDIGWINTYLAGSKSAAGILRLE